MIDEVIERSLGALDLMLGRRQGGWDRLDVSADGFWNSFLAIPACAPAILIILLSHTRWLQSAGIEASTPAVLGMLVVIELANWVLTLLIVALLARPLGIADRIPHLVVALNWGSVTFAYARAIPSALTLVTGVGEFLAVAMLVLTVAMLVLYWRLLAAAANATVAVPTALFIATVAFGYALSIAAQSSLGLVPEASR